MPAISRAATSRNGASLTNQPAPHQVMCTLPTMSCAVIRQGSGPGMTPLVWKVPSGSIRHTRWL